ncbi:MAG: DUF4345 family protein [Pseudomonadota bacterium]
MRQFVIKLTLALSGILLIVIGLSLMIAPRIFLAASAVHVETDPGLMSEIIAPVGALILAGSWMVLGALQSRHTRSGLLIGFLVYGSYGLCRLIAMLLHGAPPKALMTAMALELAIAALLLVLRIISGFAASFGRVSEPREPLPA